jgi:hypothetical protein
MCHSYSFSTPLLLLAAALATVQLSYAAPQSPRNASASSSKLRSQAENGDAVAQYNLAQSYLRHDPTVCGTGTELISDEEENALATDGEHFGR